MLLNAHPIDFYSFLERKGKAHRSWQQLSLNELLEMAFLVHLAVSHNEEASLAELPLLPLFQRMNKYLLSTYYFPGNLSYTQLNEKLQVG